MYAYRKASEGWAGAVCSNAWFGLPRRAQSHALGIALGIGVLKQLFRTKNRFEPHLTDASE